VRKALRKAHGFANNIDTEQAVQYITGIVFRTRYMQILHIKIISIESK